MVHDGFPDIFFLHNAKPKEDRHLFELIGCKMIKFFKGTKLNFEPKELKKQNEANFITPVEFSAEDPYGKTVALLDLTSESIKVKETKLVLPLIVSAYIITDILKNGDNGGFPAKGGSVGLDNGMQEVCGSHAETKQIIPIGSMVLNTELNADSVKGGGFCSGCGSGCGSMVRCKGCGSGHGGGGCIVETGGCDSGHGGGGGCIVTTGGCGSGHGGGDRC